MHAEWRDGRAGTHIRTFIVCVCVGATNNGSMNRRMGANQLGSFMNESSGDGIYSFEPHCFTGIFCDGRQRIRRSNRSRAHRTPFHTAFRLSIGSERAPSRSVLTSFLLIFASQLLAIYNCCYSCQCRSPARAVVSMRARTKDEQGE